MQRMPCSKTLSMHNHKETHGPATDMLCDTADSYSFNFLSWSVASELNVACTAVFLAPKCQITYVPIHWAGMPPVPCPAVYLV